jgi:hypothetical protein
LLVDEVGVANLKAANGILLCKFLTVVSSPHEFSHEMRLVRLLNKDTLSLDEGTLLLDEGTLLLDEDTLLLDEGTLLLDEGTLLLDEDTLLLDEDTSVIQVSTTSGGFAGNINGEETVLPPQSSSAI